VPVALRWLTVAGIVAGAAGSTYLLASAGYLTLAIVFGAGAPIATLADWWSLQKLGPERGSAADRMLGAALIAMIGFVWLAETANEQARVIDAFGAEAAESRE
jgi:hypothetical protein